MTEKGGRKNDGSSAREGPSQAREKGDLGKERKGRKREGGFKKGLPPRENDAAATHAERFRREFRVRKF